MTFFLSPLVCCHASLHPLSLLHILGQVTSRILWFLLHQYLGGGLRCMRLRGLLLSAQGRCLFIRVLAQSFGSLKCPRLHELYLLHTRPKRLAQLPSPPGRRCGCWSCVAASCPPASLTRHPLVSTLAPRNTVERRPTSVPSNKDRARWENEQAPRQQGSASSSWSSTMCRPSRTSTSKAWRSWERLGRLELRDTFPRDIQRSAELCCQELWTWAWRGCPSSSF